MIFIELPFYKYMAVKSKYMVCVSDSSTAK